jgi:hypothetical protein
LSLLLLVCSLGEAKLEAANNRERGGALALGGRRFNKINNNQMEDGVDMKGCIGEEARLGRNVWGGWLPVFWGGKLIDKKNREMGGPFALDGRRLMEGHNNQHKVGINNGRSIEEERQPGVCTRRKFPMYKKKIWIQQENLYNINFPATTKKMPQPHNFIIH